MKEIKSQDDIISEFIWLGNGIKKITKKITGEELIKHERERGKKNQADIIGITTNYKVLYEVWYKAPTVSDIIQKINIRQEKWNDITHRAVLLPYKKALDYGRDIGAENIYVISWDTRNNTRQIDFNVMGFISI